MSQRPVPGLLWGMVIASVCILSFALAAAAAAAAGLGGGDATETVPRTRGPLILVLWGLIGGGAFVAMGRIARGTHARRLTVGLLLAAMATGAGAAVEATIMAWAAERFGAQAADPELVGLSTALGTMAVLVGLTALAGVALPASARGAASVMAAVCGAGVLLLVAANAPGAFDGITAPGMPMGVAMIAATVATVASIGVVLRTGDAREG